MNIKPTDIKMITTNVYQSGSSVRYICTALLYDGSMFICDTDRLDDKKNPPYWIELPLLSPS